jgi:hypothetical protein
MPLTGFGFQQSYEKYHLLFQVSDTKNNWLKLTIPVYCFVLKAFLAGVATVSDAATRQTFPNFNLNRPFIL